MTYPDVRVYLDVTSSPIAPATTWVDVTSYVVESVSSRWGRSSLRDEFSPGGGRFTLKNDGGQFDPFNAAGPLYPNLKPGARVKIEATITGTTLTDSFTTPSSTWDPAVWSQIGSGGVTVAGGNLSIVNATSTATRGLQSLSPFALIDTAVTVNGITYPSTLTGVTAWPLMVRLGANEYAAIGHTGGNMIAVKGVIDPYVGFVETTLRSVPLTHSWVRIRRVGSTTYWEASTTGSGTWYELWHEDVPWAEPSNVTIQVKTAVVGSPGGTSTLVVGSVSIAQTATHPVAYGWCEGFNQDQTWKYVNRVPVNFHDALTRLARSSMPDSVWDYRIKQLDPMAWYQLGGETATVEDHSTHGNHAAWEVVEGLQYEGNGNPVPDVVVKAGQVEEFIPLAGRPGTSWAKMYPELGSTPGGTIGVPRSPIVNTGTYIAFLGNYDWTIECWIQFRQAFPLNLAGGVGAATTPVWQPIILAGHEHNPSMFLGVDEDGNPQLYFGVPPTWSISGYNWTGVTLFDGKPHHCVWASRQVGSNMYVKLFVDGVQYTEIDFGVVFTPYTWPLTIGQPQWVDRTTSLQSTIGDVIFYDGTMTSTMVREHYNAGKWGSLASFTMSAYPDSGSQITDALAMVDWTVAKSIATGGQPVRAEVTANRGALEYVRRIATSERGPLWQEPDGTLTFWLRNWPVAQPRAKYPMWKLADDGTGTAGMGYSALDFDISDARIVTEAEVTWAGGKQRSESAAAITSFGHLREQVDTALESPEQAKDYADWLVFSYGQHHRFVTRPLVFEPFTPAEWSFALGARFGTRVTVVRTTPDGRTITDDLWVQAVAHDFDVGEGAWRTSITFEPADEPARMWTWGESTWGGPDVFGY